MFRLRRAKRNDSNSTDDKPAGKSRRKDSGRKVWGFPCSPAIPPALKALADELHVPVYALTEHCLQLGAGQVAEVNKDAEEREILRDHIIERHVGQRAIEKMDRYDEEEADILSERRRAHLEQEKAAHTIVAEYLRRGAKPYEVIQLIEAGGRYFEAQNRYRRARFSETTRKYSKDPPQPKEDETERHEDDQGQDSAEQSS